MVVSISKNIYENYIKGGHTGAVYNHCDSGLFDMNLFEIWFKILLSHVNEHGNGNENLALNFSPIKVSIENNIYISVLNAIHLLQPLDIEFFAPVKTLADGLDKWR